MSEGTKINTSLVVVAVLLFAAFFTYMMLSSSGPGLFKVETKGGNSIVLDFSGREYELSKLLDDVMADQAQADIVRAMLRERYGLYSIDSTEFVDYLRRLSPQDELSKEIIGLLVDGAGPFDHQFHTYRNIHSLSAALEIIELDHDSPAAVRLREASNRQEGIFQQEGIPVRVTRVPASQISDSDAAVCSSRKHRFIGHDLLLTSGEQSPRMVSVYAEKPFHCTLPADETAKDVVMINTNTAERLYGSAAGDQLQRALLYIVPLGYQVKTVMNEEAFVSMAIPAEEGER
ncbi:hypothetical protein RE428_38470 [Marinobacter nanhaiticus D15-8W]|uniref:Uncharacterized protein n=1 Tax=Marinobacter nanhaiticus D15-8W TaxID=626887 RepID=N6X5E6_9GAMM|nr:hypothetical protein [Marinobacter nanhaiticus]ENO16313.1 hypothetical protein J057_13191 [Marinobacter nanhaiticus D15-8W]BES72829.1 hypothetical protein RE428_38470 [Marinobacter nanhaiticus D15-8W]